MENEQAQQSDIGAGERLRQAREAAELTIFDVSDRMKISGNVIEALESEDLDHLPGPTYVYGYLRTYSRLLELPVDEIIASFPKLEEEKHVKVKQPSYLKEPKPVQVNNTLLLAAVFVVIIAGAWLLANYLSGSEEESEAGDKQATEQAGKGTPTTEGTKRKLALPPPGSEQVRPPSETAVTTTPAQSGKTAGTGEATKQNQSPPPTQAMETIQFTFSGPCWVEVIDARGERLIYKTLDAPSVTTVTGVPPFTMTLGKVPNVQVKYKGEVLNFAGRRSDYVKMKLGEAAPAQ